MYTDTQDGILGTNMYAYCQNDPVNAVDPEGTDAIYMVEYEWGNYGLTVAGHSSLFIQDAKGVWWFTEFSGSSLDPRNAKVRTKIATDTEWARAKAPRTGLWKGSSTALLEGDFSEGLNVAKFFSKADEGKGPTDVSRFGPYSLYGNNCLSYVLKILLTGTFEDNAVFRFLNQVNPLTTIPSLFYAELLAVLRLSGVKKPK